jgi:hypothetical protein
MAEAEGRSSYRHHSLISISTPKRGGGEVAAVFTSLFPLSLCLSLSLSLPLRFSSLFLDFLFRPPPPSLQTTAAQIRAHRPHHTQTCDAMRCHAAHMPYEVKTRQGQARRGKARYLLSDINLHTANPSLSLPFLLDLFLPFLLHTSSIRIILDSLTLDSRTLVSL